MSVYETVRENLFNFVIFNEPLKYLTKLTIYLTYLLGSPKVYIDQSKFNFGMRRLKKKAIRKKEWFSQMKV